MGRRMEWLVGYWSESPWLDYVAAAVVVGAHLLVIEYAGHGDLLNWIDLSQRITVYGTGAAIISIVGGLNAIATSIYVAAEGNRARAVRALYHAELRTNWRALLIGVGLSATACLIAQIVDDPGAPLSARVLFEVAMIFAALRFLRLVWLFDAILRVTNQDLADPARVEAPELGPMWRRKVIK